MRRRVDERRRAPRLRIALRVRVNDEEGGVSRDISAVGIFVDTDRLPPSSEPVRLSVALGEWDTQGGFRIHGEGRVVRTDTRGTKPGIGLDVVWSDIEPLGPPAAALVPVELG